MKKRYLRKWMIGLLCGAFIVSNAISTGLQVSATEMELEQTNMDNGQNVVGIIDEADNALSNNDVKNENFPADDLEDENEEKTTPEELKSGSQEQEKAENEGAEGDSAKNEVEDSEKEEGQGSPDDVEENTIDGKKVNTGKMSSLETEKGLILTTSDNDIASGSYEDITWVIDAKGKLTVDGTGDFIIASVERDIPWYEYRQFIKTAEINVTEMTRAAYMFNGCTNLTSVDLSNFDTSQVMNMHKMFCECSSLTSLDLSGFDTSNVTDMSYMFSRCGNLTSIGLSSFNTENVKDMSRMFSECGNLTNIDLSNFDTKNVRKMEGMFYSCSNLTSIDVSEFDTSKVIGMESMFSGCGNLTNIDLSNFNTSNVTDMSYMFCASENLTNIDLSNFNTKNVENMRCMFSRCGNLINIDLSNFNTKNVRCMSFMFSGCSSLTNVDLSSFDTRNVADMSSMFSGCSSLTNLDLSSFDTSNAADMRYMFEECSSLTNLDLSSFDTRNVTNMVCMFYECNSLTNVDLSNFDMGKVIYVSHMLYNCNNLTTIYTPCNLIQSVELVSGPDVSWYLSDGTVATELPQNLNYSVVVKKKKNDGLNYVQNLTQVSLKNANAESKKSIENAIYNLLFKAEYRPLNSLIPGDTMEFTGSKDVIAKWPIQNVHYNTQAYWNRTVNDAQLGSVKFNNAGAGCMAYAYFATTYTYGTSGSKKPCSNTSAEGIKEFIHQYADPGEHLRYQKPHSLVFLGESSDGKGFYCISYEGGASASGTYHLLRLMYKSYDDFSSEVAGKLSIFDVNNGSYYNGTAKSVAAVRSGNDAEKIIMRLACPVEAIIEHNGEILDSRSIGTTSYGMVERDDDEIIFTVDYSPDYNLSIIGTGEGVMTLTLEYYDNSNTLIDKRGFVRVPIKESTEIESSGFDSQSAFVLYISDESDEVVTWGAGIGETVYSSDNIYRGDNDVDDNSGSSNITNVFGDANSDGRVDSKDAVMMRQYMAGYANLDINLTACDVNADGRVDSKDVVKLLRKLAGYDVVLGEK